MMSYSNICMLCLRQSDDLFKIFGKTGIQLNTGSTLNEHFWFEVSESDDRSICVKCWWTVQNFHNFYNSVKINHKRHEFSFDVKSVIVGSDEGNEIVELLDVIENEPSIDNKNDCSSDIPDGLDCRASESRMGSELDGIIKLPTIKQKKRLRTSVSPLPKTFKYKADTRESSVEPEDKSVAVDANERNKIVELLDVIKNEPSIDLENDIDGFSDIPDANERNEIVELPDIFKREPSIDLENYIDCSSNIPDRLDSLARESCVKSEDESVAVDANEHNKIKELPDIVKTEPSIDLENDIDCSSDIPDGLNSRASESFVNLEDKSVAVDANEHNEIVEWLDVIKNEPSIDIENDIDCSSNIPDRLDSLASEPCIEPELDSVIKLPAVKQKKRLRNYKYKSDAHIELLSTHFNMSCDVCGSILKSHRDMKVHFRNVHNGMRGYLICCGKKYYNLEHMLQHCQYHINPKSFKCDQCTKTFRDKTGLRGHVIICHSPDNEKLFNCNDCEKTFSKLYLLNSHMRTSHHYPMKPKKKVKKAKNHGDITVVKSHINKEHRNDFLHICEVCAKTFVSNWAFQMHYLACHTNISQKVQCDICKIWLKHKKYLKDHFLRHNSKKATCTICGRVYKNQTAMTSHIRYAHREPSFQCIVCREMFKKRSTLKDHMAIHTGIINLYKCTFCTHSFRSRSYMYTHRTRAHPKEMAKRKATHRQVD